MWSWWEAAALLAFGISAALLHRERHGVGQLIDTSLLSAALFSTIPRDGETLRSGRAPERLGSRHPTMVPYGNYQGSDGRYFFAACFTEKFWQNLCRAIEREDLLSDQRFIGSTARTANRNALDTILEQEFLMHTADYWVAHLNAADMPCAKVQ
ncbi:CoA transferase [Caballeronia sp. LZ024]|uniref:CoA transferase n=2 Tax=unclassified Caballeronia TaxID=2646786 RepID=UPI00286B99D0|nr:CoA transferase [Caballeronia sp. LZ024]